MPTRPLRGLCVALLWGAASFASADLIVNGSFEQPPVASGYEYVPGGNVTISGWQTILTGAERFDPSTTPRVSRRTGCWRST